MSEAARVAWVGSSESAPATTESDAAGDAIESLEDAGFAVERLGVGQVVQSVASDRPDCLVCSSAIEDADPVETITEVGEHEPGLPVVLVAVDGNESLAHRAVAAGVSEYVPLAGDADLVAAVERAVEAGETARDRTRAKTQLEALFEDAPHPSIEYEFVDGEPFIRSANRAFAEAFGYDREAVTGRPMNDVIVPEGREDEAESLDRRIRDGGRVDAELRRETTDGVREFLFRNIAVDTADGPDGYAIYVDITDQKERERRLREQNERLNEFTSVVSHDLRNPMGAVRHRIEMARQTGDDAHLDDAMGALDRMAELLSDLLRLARQGEETGETEPVSLAAVAETAWSHVATHEATLTIDEDTEIIADRGRLTQLLENLFINAIEHATDDGDADIEIRVGVGDDGCVYVEDDGRGIPASERQDVFDSGYSTDNDGTGYGLAIVRQVTHAHGWEVGVAESVDGGARFEFRGVEFVGS